MSVWLVTYLVGCAGFAAIMIYGVKEGLLDWSEDEAKYPGITALVCLIVTLGWPLVVALMIIWRLREDDDGEG